MRNKTEEYFDGKDTLEKTTYFYQMGKIRNISYKLNGEFHRADGPSEVTYSLDGTRETLFYEIKGKIHREDGPAIIRHNYINNKKTEKYYLNGIQYSNLVLDCPINRELYKGKFIENNGSLWVRENI